MRIICYIQFYSCGDIVTKITVCGDKDRRLTRSIIGCCEQYGGAVLYGCDELKKSKIDCRFLICEVSELSSVTHSDSVLVLADQYKHKDSDKLCCSPSVVFSSSNTDAVNALKGSVSMAVSCGTSPKDTLSAASIFKDDKITVSLQRTIKTLENNIIEPQDFLVCRKNNVLYSTLACSAVLLLSGIPFESGYSF